MKCILTFVFSLLFLTVSGQKMSYDEWQLQAKSNMRLLPEYGNIPKTDAIKQIDEDFIRTALIKDSTYRTASDHYVDLGFKYFLRDDIKTAMYRFNQAWLLDPKNENVYWGFGAIYFYFNDLDKAKEMYDRGLAINPRNASILTDKATIYLAMMNNQFDTSTFGKAVELFNQSYLIDPKNQNTSYKMSTMYFSINDCKNARKYYELCMKEGGNPITEEYTKALNEKCK